MPILGGANEVVVGEIEVGRQLTKNSRNLVGKLLRRNALGFCRPLDLLPVLIRASEKMHVIAVQTLEPRHDIGGQRGVRVTNVGTVVDVVDRRRDVVSLFGHS
ncbi:MAG: Uncharacterised protein [Pseudidiomarina mangrovi]|nr:MAG: Uncharacterised protein [Pseudidiomarina mangrovi]